MKLTPAAFALLVTGGLLSAAPAIAQGYGSAPPQQPAASKPATDKPAYQPNVSKAAHKEIVALQEAVNAKDTANIPAKLAAAQAKAETKDDRYVIAQLQIKAAVDAKDEPGMVAGLEAVLASGVLAGPDATLLYMDLGKIRFNAKSYDQAGVAFEEVLKADPNNVDAIVLLAETRNFQKRTPEAVSLIQKAIAAKSAAGQKPEESWYKRAVSLSYNGNMPNAVEIGRQWVGAYPSPGNWRDALRIYETSSGQTAEQLVDIMRLAYATNALVSENDYFRLANAIVTKNPGEAKAVLDAGFAAKHINKSKATFAQLYSVASTKSQGDRASLPAAAKTALAGGDPRKIMGIADAFYGYGDYGQAVDLYKAALTKPGVDKDLANLRLGMSLARAGDKAGAAAALNAAGGAQAEPAKFWLVYLQTKG